MRAVLFALTLLAGPSAPVPQAQTEAIRVAHEKATDGGTKKKKKDDEEKEEDFAALLRLHFTS